MTIDVSVIMPYWKKLTDFQQVLPYNFSYLNVDNVEIVLVLDEPTEADDVLSFIDNNGYSGAKWKIIKNLVDHAWRPPSKAINVGIKHAVGTNILILSPETIMVSNLPAFYGAMRTSYSDETIVGRFAHCTYTDLSTTYGGSPIAACNGFYESHASLPLYYGSTFVLRSKAEEVHGFDESLTKWGGADDNFRIRLRMTGIAEVQTNLHYVLHMSSVAFTPGKGNNKTVEERYAIMNPENAVANGSTWGVSYDTVIRDYSA